MDDEAAVASHAQSLSRVLTKLHAALSSRCGLGDTPKRAELEASLHAAVAKLVVECAKLQEEVEEEEAQEGPPAERMAAVSIA